MKVQPLGNRVLVQTQVAEKSEGGLYYPGNLDQRYLKGEVLSVGVGQPMGTYEQNIILKQMAVKAGDVVLYDKHMAIDVGDGKFLVAEMDLLCKYVDTEENLKVN